MTRYFNNDLALHVLCSDLAYEWIQNQDNMGEPYSLAEFREWVQTELVPILEWGHEVALEDWEQWEKCDDI